MSESQKMPVLFVGHGSPMNAIEDNVYSRGFVHMAAQLPRPKAILAISAHWATRSLCVRTAATNPHIDDMYGFPKELYEVAYEPPGDPALAREVIRLTDGAATVNNDWGIDHGVWSILCNMYPRADVPVTVLSTPVNESPAWFYDIGKKLAPLSAAGVLILASGNIVHNLRAASTGVGLHESWAADFDSFIKEALLSGDSQRLLAFTDHPDWRKAVPSPEHFYPILAAAGAGEGRHVEVWNEGCALGALSMTSYIFT